ncbi:ran GTPase-activating protein 1 [Diutina catenulata]
MTTYSPGKQLKLDSSEHIKPYVDALRELDNVTKIDFSGNTLGVEASADLADAVLKHKDTVTEIDFSDLYTGRLNTEIPKSLDHLLPALLKCPKLTTLNLSDNAFGLQTIDPIEKYLGQAVTLEHLILSNNGMGPFAGARIGASLFAMGQKKKQAGKPSLKTFVCGRNRLENGSVNHLAVGLGNHPDLAEVRLYQNGIRPAGATKLIVGLANRLHKLRVLDLQDNTVTARGGLALAEALTNSWTEITELNLNDALLKPKGALAVVKALPKSVTTLKLQYNELRADAVEELAAAVKNGKLPQLAIVELNGNQFEEELDHAETLKEALEAQGGELDELDELEELDSDEEDEDDDDEGADELEEDLDLEVLEKDLAGTAEQPDKAVDEIADELAGTHIK